jgi:hypothetical protein
MILRLIEARLNRRSLQLEGVEKAGFDCFGAVFAAGSACFCGAARPGIDASEANKNHRASIEVSHVVIFGNSLIQRFQPEWENPNLRECSYAFYFGGDIGTQVMDGTASRESVTLVLYRTRVLAERWSCAGCLCARSIKPLEGSRPWLRRTRVLCKFNCGKVRCPDLARLCERARQPALREKRVK